MENNTLGAYIRSRRQQNNMTQSQLAARLNITDKAVSKWERDLSYPDIKLFPKLADALGVNVSDLLDTDTEEGSPSKLEQIFEMSPDFRTPLHIILGCADLVERHYESKDRVHRYLQSIRISGEYLLDMIDKTMQANRNNKVPHGDPCSFTWDLNKHLKEEICDRKTRSAKYDFTGRRILIAEDMEINREIVGELLKQHGAQIEFAEDGQVCLRKVLNAPASYYDLILMDIKMPNMDGIEATRSIRRLSDIAKASIPIIAVTANVYDKDRDAAIKAGMNDFTEKPISVEKLFGIMEKHLQAQL